MSRFKTAVVCRNVAGSGKHVLQAALSSASLLAIAFGSVPAWADGGTGPFIVGATAGAGGVDGTLAQATGLDGAFAPNASSGASGGGGAVDLTTGNGAPGGARGGGGIDITGQVRITPQVLGTAGATGAAGLVVTTATDLSTAITGGAGGAGQVTVDILNSAGGGGNTAGGGGGGGVGISAAAALTIAATGRVTGGAGAAGVANGGASGGGGAGVFSTALVTVAAGGQITGGMSGSATATVAGGGGGMGVLLAAGSGLINSGTILGGLGGAGGTVGIGGAGDGGAGVWVTGGGTVVNASGASITGGVGGKGKFSASGSRGGLGGEGVKGIDITLINAGAITAGMGGVSTGGPVLGQANAVTFLGGVNALEIQAGSVISGNVVAFSAADTLRLGGSANASFDVSQVGAAAQYRGFGIYEKTGASIWTLTGATTAVTPWTMTAGVLQAGSDGALGDRAGKLTFNGGTLENTASFNSTRDVTVNDAGGIIQTDADLTLSGTVSGTGTLTKTGAGNLILTINSANTGGIVVTAGAVELATGGNVTGNVANDDALVFGGTGALTLGGVISGSGTVSQSGTGTTTLSANNSYAGGTTITAGTLAGSASSFGSGAILNDAALVIDQPADAAFANTIDGSGSFTKEGAGRLNYTGTGSFSGSTTVAAGLLSVNGSLANSAVTVASGGALGGNGTVGATTIQTGAFVAPGNSIGTLHIDGAFVQSAGSTYRVEVDPNSNTSDLIAVDGAATLQSGAGLSVAKYVPGDYRPGTVYKVLSASGGLTGTYAVSGQTSGVSAFLALKDSYDANNAYLTVVQTGSLATAAETPNQQAVAQALDSQSQTAPTNPMVGAVLNSPDAPSARAAFDQLAGQSQASAQAALLGNGLYMREVAFDRLRDVICVPGTTQQSRCQAHGLSIWEQGFGGWGGIAGNANASGLNHSSAGFLVGADVPAEDWRLGFFGGYSHGDFHLTASGAAGGSDDYHLGAYGGTLLGDVALRLGGSYSWSGVTSDRAVLIGNFRDALRATYNGGTTQVFGELGYGMAMDGMMFEPFANLTYVGLHTEGFTEAGGAAALTVRANTTENMIATLGVRPSLDVDLGGFGGTLRGLAGWRHTFGSVTPDAQVSFAGGNVFGVSGVSIARDAAALEAGFDVGLADQVSLGLTYGGQFSGKSTDQTARGTLRVSF
jgi:outer membrane autotransporter protein